MFTHTLKAVIVGLRWGVLYTTYRYIHLLSLSLECLHASFSVSTWMHSLLHQSTHMPLASLYIYIHMSISHQSFFSVFEQQNESPSISSHPTPCSHTCLNPLHCRVSIAFAHDSSTFSCILYACFGNVEISMVLSFRQYFTTLTVLFILWVPPARYMPHGCGF